MFFNSGRPAQGAGRYGSDEILDFSGGTKPEKRRRRETAPSWICVDGAAQWKCKTIKIENDQKGIRKKKNKTHSLVSFISYGAQQINKKKKISQMSKYKEMCIFYYWAIFSSQLKQHRHKRGKRNTNQIVTCIIKTSLEKCIFARSRLFPQIIFRRKTTTTQQSRRRRFEIFSPRIHISIYVNLFDQIFFSHFFFFFFSGG